MLMNLILSKISNDITSLLKERSKYVGPFWFTEQKDTDDTLLEYNEGMIEHATAILKVSWKQPIKKKIVLRHKYPEKIPKG
jgi:hypothetical protein